MEKYVELIKDAENLDDLDHIVETAAHDDKITHAEYFKLHRLATEKYYHL
jgi:hypothetical protein